MKRNCAFALAGVAVVGACGGEPVHVETPTVREALDAGQAPDAREDRAPSASDASSEDAAAPAAVACAATFAAMKPSDGAACKAGSCAYADGACTCATPFPPVAGGTRWHCAPKISCPSTFAAADALASTACTQTGASSCTYPEGTCACASDMQCGGAPRPPMPPSWRCAKKTPGCPTSAVEDGAPCKPVGKVCSAGWSCAQLECTARGWKTSMPMLP